MTQDHIRRALSVLGEAQNILHAAMANGDETVLREYQQPIIPITEQDIREGEEQVRKGEWVSLTDLRAELMAETGRIEQEARIEALETQLAAAREALREGMAVLFDKHPDDLGGTERE